MAKRADLEVGASTINLLLDALGSNFEQKAVVEGVIDGASVKVRNRAFTGPRGGRVVKLEGFEHALASAASVILSVLASAEVYRHWASELEVSSWAYADPVNKGKVHTGFPMKTIIYWRKSGPFTDDMLVHHKPADCWLPLWLARSIHEMESPPKGSIQSALLESRQQALEAFGDGDEAMMDMEGQEADAMTRELISFRQPGNSLHQYAASVSEEANSVQLPDAMDYTPEGKRQLTVVLDTNVLVEKLSLLQQMCEAFAKLLQSASDNVVPCIVIPSIVLAELDGLKKGESHVAARSRRAMRWLDSAHKESQNVIRGQTALDRRKAAQLYRSPDSPPTNDDLVLYCAMYLRERQSEGSQPGLAKVFLLTDDVNLRVRAHAEQLGALGFEEAPCSTQQAIDLCLAVNRGTAGAQVIEGTLVPQMLWKLQEDDFWIQAPEQIISKPRPWAAETAVQVLLDQWSTFGEMAGTKRRQTEALAKRLRQLVGGKGPRKSPQDDLEGAQVLLELLQALGPPDLRDEEPQEGTSHPSGAGPQAAAPSQQPVFIEMLEQTLENIVSPQAAQQLAAATQQLWDVLSNEQQAAHSEWTPESRQQMVNCFRDRTHAATLYKKMALLQQIADSLQQQHLTAK
ncbi:hypothetical protein WJX73_006820 [Symbiochloris irregularis]|uniref:PIN domain-containing protein n=1 Tax=Symbiochloris irregularis TaxID=706552 RepID=A0AAW1NXJ8_9CHLO